MTAKKRSQLLSPTRLDVFEQHVFVQARELSFILGNIVVFS